MRMSVCGTAESESTTTHKEKRLRMNKHGPLSALVFAGLVTLLSTSAAADRPNIVLILADDVSADVFSCYGQPAPSSFESARIAQAKSSLR